MGLSATALISRGDGGAGRFAGAGGDGAGAGTGGTLAQETGTSNITNINPISSLFIL